MEWNLVWDVYRDHIYEIRKSSQKNCWCDTETKWDIETKWTNSLHVCEQILKNLDSMRERWTSKRQNYQKDEGIGRIKNDREDRASIRKALGKCVNPLNLYYTGLMNNYTRFLTEIKVNVYDLVKIGKLPTV